MKRTGLLTLLILFTATAATADERLPVETVFAGNMALPWAKAVETHEARDVKALAATGLWAQLPLATRQEFERGGEDGRYATFPRLAAVAAVDRAARVVSITKRDDRTIVLVYRIAPESTPGAKNVHLVVVPRRGRLVFQAAASSAPGGPRGDAATGMAERLAGARSGGSPGAADEGSSRIEVCHSYDCGAREPIALPGSAWSGVDALFATTSRDPAEERGRISRAIGLLEAEVGPLAGTSDDRGGWAGNAYGVGTPGQQDCLDESANTTTFLGLMVRRGLIRFHRPEASRSRGFFAAHYSASMRDLESGRVYVVDSWFRDNGQPAVIQTLKDWKAKKKYPDLHRVVINRPLGG